MTTRVQSGGPGTGIAPTPSAPRVTPAPNRPFAQVLDAGARSVVATAEGAVRHLPGGQILAAAFRPGGSPVAPVPAGASAEGSAGTAAGAAGSGASGVEGALAQSAEMNLYYLELQERMSAENRHYTTVSNVMKARHDTVKNAISNIR